MTASRSLLKTATKPRREPRKPPLGWSDVVAVLFDDTARFQVLAKLRDKGFTADSFATKRMARAIVADALSRLEDGLELAAIDAGGDGRGLRRKRLTEQREALAVVRRQLEGELR